ncbi:MAG: response regulator [Bacteroidetes bacterium]|nr:MAG: response regulator [Bacteroidota bacterium]
MHVSFSLPMSPSDLPKIAIDLVEDNLSDATLIQISLAANAHCEIVFRHFSHPPAYLEALSQPAIPGLTLVLTDFMMPFMNGLGLLNELRSRFSAEELPVFICTGGYLSDADLAACQRADVSGVITKPIDTDEWVQILHDQFLPSLKGWPIR